MKPRTPPLPSSRLIGGIATATAFAVAASMLGACANPQRSRNVANPAVPATVLAQQVCANCHGLSGRSTSPRFPNLAGQPAGYLEMQLTAMRDRRRRDDDAAAYMWGLARDLSNEQIHGLAIYFSDQRVDAPISAGPAREVAAGQALYEQGRPAMGVPACAACHGARGQGLGVIPRLAGQHPGYLARQLELFGTAPALRPDGAPMTPIAQALSADDRRDVAIYLATLQEQAR